METIYLANGQEANLIQKIDDNNFLVEPIIIHTDYDGKEYDEPGNRIVVEQVFKSPPIEKKHEDYLTIFDKITTKNKELQNIEIELSKARGELRRIEGTTNNLSKLIFNRSELKAANRITVFPKDRIIPIDVNDKAKRDLKITIELSIIKGEERRWAAQCCGDSWGSSDYLDPEYDFLLDATDEEILQTAKDRVEAKPDNFFSRWVIVRTPDIYLTEELMQKKLQHKKEDADEEEKKLKDIIESSQKKLKDLQNKV